MIDHLPECSVRTYTTDDGMVYEVAGDLCICPALRACEQRVREEHATEWQTEQEEIHVLGLNLAYRKGLDAAREAVAALPKEDGGYCHVLHACDVEAAIDALKEKP